MSNAPSAREQRELRALFGVPAGEKLGLDDWGWLRILASGYGEELEEKGYFYLTAKELKELSGREPRLMAKHDFSTSRPWIFKELGLGILPVSRSEYFIGRWTCTNGSRNPPTPGRVLCAPWTCPPALTPLISKA